MKRIFLIAAFCASLATTYGQDQALKPFSITGDVTDLGDSLSAVYLFYSTNGENKTDSSKVENGKYNFKGMLAEPVLGRLRVAYKPDAEGKPRRMSSRRDMGAVYLEPASVTVTSIDSFSNFQVKGSSIHEEYAALAKKVDRNEPIQALSAQYGELAKVKDEDGMKAVVEKIRGYQKESKDEYLKYIRENPNSRLGVYALSQYAGWDIDPAEVEPVFLSLSEASRNSPSGKDLLGKIEKAKKTSVGAMAMDFTQNDTLGKPVSLSSYKGKYVLIDFWASWCGPCRVENPNVVKAYQTYNDKGFEVLGISLDQPDAKDKWIKAIHDDNLTWTHVSDLQFWKNAVAVQYGIQAIPQNFLVDPQGKIIAKNLRGEALQEKLKELFEN